MIDQNVINIARSSRRWAMRNRKRFFAADCLGGMCAIASSYLHRQLEKQGIRSKLAINEQHCFVVMGSHIIDITATQFDDDHPAVCIVKLNTASQEYWWIEEMFNKVDALYRYQIKSGWPSDQLALFGEHK